MKHILQAEQVSSGYGKVVVLRNINLRVNEGEILGIIGRNGMGKTTLIKTLSGLLPLTDGSITLDGADVSTWKADQRARRGVATVPQGRGMFDKLTVMEHLKVGQLATGHRGGGALHDVFLYFPRLSERRNQKSGTLSGGEQQMLAIGTALMSQPRVLLLDEPSEGVMPTVVSHIAETLDDIRRKKGISVLLVEQNASMVFDLADRCIVLENGEIVMSDGVEKVRSNPEVRRMLAL